MDLIDLADPIRLLILLLPERYRGPAAALITALVAAQGIAASIVSRLPLAAAQHPRWGRVVRALHWYSLLRFRDEKGTTKAIGADLAPRVTVAPAPSGVAHPAQLFAPSFDPTARQTIAPEVVAQIAGEGERGSTSLSAAVVAACLVGLVLSVGAMLSGCPASQQLTRPVLGPVDGCEPRATRCAPNGRPQVCSGSRHWTDADNVCAEGVNVAAVCCLTRSPVTGAELHACVLAERCTVTRDGGL